MKDFCYQATIIRIPVIVNRFGAAIQCGIFFVPCPGMKVSVAIGHTDKRPVLEHIVICGIADSPFTYGVRHDVQTFAQSGIVESAFNVHRPSCRKIIDTETAAIKIQKDFVLAPFAEIPLPFASVRADSIGNVDRVSFSDFRFSRQLRQIPS